MTFPDQNSPNPNLPQYGVNELPPVPPIQSPAAAPAQYGVTTTVPVYPAQGAMPVYPVPTATYGPGGFSQAPLDAPRPGIAPLRPMTLGEILQGALSAFRHNPAVALGLPLLILAIASAIGIGVGRLFVNPIERQLNAITYDLASQFGPEAGLGGTMMTPQLANNFGSGIGNTLIAWFAAPIVGGLLAIAISRSVLGDRISAGNAWQRLRPRIPALIGWALLSSLIMAAVVLIPLVILTVLVVALGEISLAAAVIVGLLLGLAWIALIFWVSIRMMLIPPTIALEGRPFGESVRRGWGLSKGVFWRLLGIYLLAHLLIGAVASILALPFGGFTAITAALGGATATGAAASAIVAGLISTLVTTILGASVLAMLYLDTRMRREGLDATLRQSVAATPVQVATPYPGNYGY